LNINKNENDDNESVNNTEKEFQNTAYEFYVMDKNKQYHRTKSIAYDQGKEALEYMKQLKQKFALGNDNKSSNKNTYNKDYDFYVIDKNKNCHKTKSISFESGDDAYE